MKYPKQEFIIARLLNYQLGDIVTVLNHLDWVNARGVIVGINFDRDGQSIDYTLAFDQIGRPFDGFSEQYIISHTPYKGEIDWEIITDGTFC